MYSAPLPPMAPSISRRGLNQNVKIDGRSERRMASAGVMTWPVYSMTTRRAGIGS